MQRTGDFAAKPLRWGADREGEGPTSIRYPGKPDRMVGFEVDLANELGRVLGRRGRVGPPGRILFEVFDRREIDIGLNGYEYTSERARRYRASIPYYIYELALWAVRGNDPSTASWSSLRQPSGNGRRKRIGVGRVGRRIGT